jgi:hypothetical protein
MRTMFSTQKPHRPRSALSGREQLLRRHDLLKTGPSLVGASGYLGGASRRT